MYLGVCKLWIREQTNVQAMEGDMDEEAEGAMDGASDGRSNGWYKLRK